VCVCVCVCVCVPFSILTQMVGHQKRYSDVNITAPVMHEGSF